MNARYTGDPEQLPAVGTALYRYGNDLAQQARTIATIGQDANRAAELAVQRLERTLRAAVAVRATVDPADSAALAEAERRVVQAETNVHVGRDQQRLVRRTIEDLDAAVRARFTTAERIIGSGRQRLVEFARLVERATSAFDAETAQRFGRAALALTRIGGDGGSNGSSGVSRRSSGGGPAAPAAAQLISLGIGRFHLVPLAGIDQSESTVHSPADFDDRAELNLLRTSLRRLESGVLPIVRNGGGRAEAAALDERAGLTGTPSSHLATFDGFFGDNTSIKLSRRPDGRFDVLNGQHRIWLARQAGIDALPAEVVNP